VWKKYDVVIRVRDRLMANLPTSFGALKHIAKRQLLEEKKEPTEEEIELRAGELEAELPEVPEEGEEKKEEVVLVFRRDENGLYLVEGNIKGLLKDVGRMIRLRGYRDAINHGVFVKPEKIYLLRREEPEGEAKPIKEADGIYRKGMRVMSPKGARSVIKNAEYVIKPELRFQLWIAQPIARRLFTERVVEDMWALAEEVGLLGDRALGEGKFDAQVKPIQE